MYKRLVVIILTLCTFIPNSTRYTNLKTNAIDFVYDSAIKNEAEKLYEKINAFLSNYEDIPPEKFDNVCKNYMMKDLKPINLLDEKAFKEIFQNNIVLYRGLSEKCFADDLKNGIIYFSTNTKNVRGMGIYTTTSLECAKRYSGKNVSETIVKMFIPKARVKILKNEYLEKLKEIIRNVHPEEYGDFSEENKDSYIFDTMSEYINEQFKELFEKIESKKIEADEQMCLINELSEKIKSDPVYQSLIANRKRYFKDNKASVFYNSGLLAKLLGFDVLYSIDYLSNIVDCKEEEYLIINPNVISILSN